MKAQGQEYSEWGFKKPSDGWHVVQMQEGIDLLKKEGVPIKDAKDNSLYKFPAKVVDEQSEDNGLDISQIIASNPFGEKKIADILAACGEFEKFEKNFPGDRSFFEQPIMDQLKIRIPGKTLKMKTETNKEGYSNVVAIASLKAVIPDSGAKTKKGVGSKSTPAATNSAPASAPGSDWD